MIGDTPRLIEDALPIDVIGRASGQEKTGARKGHPTALHRWWARRPLAASRAAVYAALVPATDRDEEVDREFFSELCAWDAKGLTIDKARREVLAANGGKAPAVIDLFSGGGAIPLEAARLGCDVTANELNPVAHLIERMMMDFPQRFEGLADDVSKWGTRWVEQVWNDVADLYPPVTEQDDQPQEQLTLDFPQATDGGSGTRRPFAYLWTRTVRCPNPALPEHRVDLLKQSWLGRKAGRLTALRPVVDRDHLRVTYEVVTASTQVGLGFDPADGSKGGKVACRVCGATVTGDYIKAEGRAGRLGIAPLTAVVLRKPERGKNGKMKRPKGREYLAAGAYQLPSDDECHRRFAALSIEPLDERLPNTMRITGGTCMVYGFATYRELFTPRQLVTLGALAAGVRQVYADACAAGMSEDRAGAVATALAMVVSKTVERGFTLCTWDNSASAEKIVSPSRQALPMVWDFAEANPFGGSSGDVRKHLTEIVEAIERLSQVKTPARCVRGSASALPVPDASQDAVITDPPYYDNISYADLSDLFYVWLKRSVGFLYPDDLGGELTPKRQEAVVAPYRHSGDKNAARLHYERMMREAFAEACRVLKPGAPMVCVYAHKTTLGWASLVEALRLAGFVITEAWPIDTEMEERAVGRDTAALASSIFLVARKRRDDAGVGFEADVMAELDSIIKARLERLERLGLTGSDLLIATVGAGLKALTRFDRVEQDNGEDFKADRFLETVQTRVLDTIFGQLRGMDAPTRFYAAAQYSYGYMAVPFDEINNLARMCSANLDGAGGLTSGGNPLGKKIKATILLRDYSERGADDKLGLPQPDTGAPAPIIDVVHGILWRAENRPADLRTYLYEAGSDLEQVRQVVQALAGKALRAPGQGAKSKEAAVAETLLVSWRSLMDSNVMV